MYHGITPKIKKILSQLRLKGPHAVSFIKLSRKSQFLLKLVEPFVTYGLPSEQVVRNLITKRGYTQIGKNRTPLTNNVMIEDILGMHNIVCLEDIIHEINTCGPHFQKVIQFLSEFRIKAFKFQNTRISFKNGGDAGWRGKKINDVLERLT